MSDDFLMERLRRVARRYRWIGLWRTLAVCWATAALVGLGVVWVQRASGHSWSLMLPAFAALAGAVATALVIRHFEKPPDYRWIARKIEDRHPELNGVLLTAVQNGLLAGNEIGYLQYRVVKEATTRSQEKDWRKIVPTARVVITQAVHLLALGCFIATLASLRTPFPSVQGISEKAVVAADGVVVSPGDASIERGDRFVVLARFARTLPPTVNLVIQENGAAARNVPLIKSLADPVFGGSLPEVTTDFTYRLEYRGERTKDFKVTVFEHPRLIRADVDLTFPGYTKLPPKHIEDTRRVSAVEGTRLDYALQLNKPVKSAKLVARDGKKTEILLKLEPGKSAALLAGHVPDKTTTYDLQLLDAEGRANKIAAPFVIDVQVNRPPEIRLLSPRGDVRPSAIEEVTFDGTVWDDFGAQAYGLAYSVAGGETKFVELGSELPAKEKRAFNHLLSLEEIKAKPDDLISWHAWADDIGPDGKVRRTSGDLYFAEVRAFDEIFRESQDMQSSDDQQQQQSGQGNQRRKLTELQKQIINATWRLQRDGANSKYANDAKVVRESQEQALAQAGEAQEEARTPREQAMWKEASQHMEKAIEKLNEAAETPGPLAQALPAEQSAYQALLKLQARETNVTRSPRRGGGGGGGQQANQRQIDQLDLKQSENRYETQRQARAPQNEERREQLAVMNRLQELARRQQDLNERLKELQTSLQEARTEAEREEIKRRLKRLEEEQRQMLADSDEVRQRMDRAENQSNMSEQRRQLDQTREDLQRAAEATGEGSVAQALASGTRAQRQLQQMRDEMRKQNSSQFADDLRDMRAEARQLAQQQEQIGQKLDGLGHSSTQRKSLSDGGDRKELLEGLAQQKERMNKLVERAQQVSEQAENTEPLLSRQLYDSVRKVSQDDANSIKQARQELISSGLMTRGLYDRLQQASDREGGGKALEVTSEMLREGYLPQASQAGQRARGEIDELRRGVERAAESVLGDDAEQLKLAQSELDQLTEQLQREITQAQGPGAGQKGAPPGSTKTPGDQRQAGDSPGQNGDSQTPGQGAQGAGQQEGQDGERSAGLADASQKQGQGGQRGQRPGQGQSGTPGGEQSATPSEQGEQQANSAQSPGGRQGQGQPGGGSGNRMAGGEDPSSPQPGAGERGREGERAGDRPGQARGNRLTGGGANDRGGNSGGPGLDNFWNGADRRGGVRWGGDGSWLEGPLTGDGFAPWADRLRDVEDLLESPDLRNAVAAARERARLLRRDLKQDMKKPDWAVVQLQILKPLVEVRTRVAEELARRDSKESLAPIDRDPVPNRFAESVRRYYEELGKDKAEATR
ncbi:MAG: hypothetical protein RIQ93_927 [Verrucomicrobiota bacterium]|jgi:hypothetical protein